MLALLTALALLQAPPPASAASAPPEGHERGLWVGSMHLCAGLVSGATLVSRLDVENGLLIELAPSAREALHRETAARLEQPLPIRLDGRVVLAPVVREPIAGGRLMIAPVDAAEAETVRDAALGPC